MDKSIDTHAIKQMADTAHNILNNTVDKVVSGADYAAEAIAKKGSELHNLQQKVTESTRSQVRNHPLLLLGLAVATGTLFSLWLNHKNN